MLAPTCQSLFHQIITSPFHYFIRSCYSSGIAYGLPTLPTFSNKFNFPSNFNQLHRKILFHQIMLPLIYASTMPNTPRLCKVFRQRVKNSDTSIVISRSYVHFISSLQHHFINYVKISDNHAGMFIALVSIGMEYAIRSREIILICAHQLAAVH